MDTGLLFFDTYELYQLNNVEHQIRCVVAIVYSIRRAFKKLANINDDPSVSSTIANLSKIKSKYISLIKPNIYSDLQWSLIFDASYNKLKNHIFKTQLPIKYNKINDVLHYIKLIKKESLLFPSKSPSFLFNPDAKPFIPSFEGKLIETKITEKKLIYQNKERERQKIIDIRNKVIEVCRESGFNYLHSGFIMYQVLINMKCEVKLSTPDGVTIVIEVLSGSVSAKLKITPEEIKEYPFLLKYRLDSFTSESSKFWDKHPLYKEIIDDIILSCDKSN